MTLGKLSFLSLALFLTLATTSIFGQEISKKPAEINFELTEIQLSALAVQGLLPSIEVVKRELPNILRNNGNREITILTARFGEPKLINTVQDEIKIALDYEGSSPQLQAIKLATALQLSAFLANTNLESVTFIPTNLGQSTNFIRNADDVLKRLDRSVFNSITFAHGADFYFTTTEKVAKSIMSRQTP